MGQLDGGREPESRREAPAGAGAVGRRPQLEQKPDVGSRRQQAKAGAEAGAEADAERLVPEDGNRIRSRTTEDGSRTTGAGTERRELDDGSKRPKWTTGRQKPDRRDSGVTRGVGD